MSEVVVAGPSSSTESELLIPCGQGDPEDDSLLYSDISSTDIPEFPGADSDEEEEKEEGKEEAVAPVPVPVPAPAPAVRSTVNPPCQSRRQTKRPRSASAVYDDAVVVGRAETNPRFYELVPVSHVAL